MEHDLYLALLFVNLINHVNHIVVLTYRHTLIFLRDVYTSRDVKKIEPSMLPKHERELQKMLRFEIFPHKTYTLMFNKAFSSTQDKKKDGVILSMDMEMEIR